MAAKATSIFPPETLARRKIRNGQPLTADLVWSLAGNAATYNAMVNGGDTLDADTPNPLQLAPGGTGRGHDHSGGLHGAPLYRSIGGTQVCDSGLEAFVVNGGDWLSNSDNPLKWEFTAGPSETTVLKSQSDLPLTVVGSEDSPDFKIPLFVPGCDRGPAGAYNRLYVGVNYVFEALTNIDTLLDVGYLQMKNTHPLAGLSDPDEAQWERQLIITAALTRRYFAGSDTTRIRVIPGQVNMIEPTFRFVTSATAGTRTVKLLITSIEIGVGEIL